MTLHGWGRAFQATNLHDTPIALQLLGDIVAHCLAYRIVVTSDKGGIFIRIGLSVIEYHRDALFVCSLHSLGDGTQLVRGDNEQIDSLVYKLIDLLVLQHIVIIRRGELHNNRIVEILARLELCIEFVAPDVLGALRYADDILLRLRSTTRE